MTQPITFLIITVSDRCSRGDTDDISGPNLASIIKNENYGNVVKIKCIPDEQKLIELELVRGCSIADVILTTGGTGFSHRDVTPEATKAVIEKDVPGLVFAMTLTSVSKTPHAILSRAICGIRGQSLIINLPGSVKGSAECFKAISETLRHAVDLIKNEANHHDPRPSIKSKVKLGNVAERPRESIWKMISYSDARLIVLLNKTLPIKEEVTLSTDLVGRVVADDVIASDPLPPFRASIKDGYAVLSNDGQGALTVTSKLTAGMLASGYKIASGECVRVNTGGPLPENADAVVQVEDTKIMKKTNDGEEMIIEIMVTPQKDQDIRQVGSDIALHEIVLKKGDVISSIELGLLATIGVTKVPVFKLPRISVLSTGDEIEDANAQLGPGKIRDSNRITLLSLLKEHHFPTNDLGIVKDEPSAILSRLIQGLDSSDIILTTGGVSMGEKDHLKGVITEDLNADVHFGRVNIKPGKPTTFATCTWKDKKKLLFCLPGNPVSATTTFHLFVMPLLKSISGHENPLSPVITVKLGFNIDKLDPRQEFKRVTLVWDDHSQVPVAHSTGDQISSRLMNWRKANCLLILPCGNDQVKRLKTGHLCQGIVISSFI